MARPTCSEAERHLVDIETQVQAWSDGKPTGELSYRWRCSCGEHGKSWHASGQHGQHAGRAARRARDGGTAHARAMERLRLGRAGT